MTMSKAVIHTIASLWKSSGVTDAAVNAANGAAIAGYDVTVITWSISGSIDDKSFLSNVTLLSLNYEKNFFKRLQKFYKVLIGRVKELKRDHSDVIIHDHGLWLESNIAAGFVANLERVPLLISVHGMLEPWAMEHRAWKKQTAWFFYQKWFLRSSSYIHVTSAAEQKSVLKLLPNQLVKEISLGTAYSDDVSSCMAYRAIFLSRIHKKKGVDLLLEAWSMSAPATWELLIVGPDDGGYSQHVLQQIKVLGLQQKVKLLGALYGKEKSQIFAQSSLFILPSYSENFGLVIAEAFMVGLPVITTNTTPWLNLNERGCGWTIAPNVTELSLALLEATQLTVQQRCAMGKIGRAWMLDQFTWDVYKQRICQLYDGMVEMKNLSN